MDFVNSFSGVFTTAGIFTLAIIICLVVGEWKIFVKAGEPGWKCLVPFYSTYIMLKRFWTTKLFPVFIFLSVFSLLQTPTVLVSDASEAVSFLTILTFIVSLASFIISCALIFKTGKAFGKWNEFCVGMILLAPIFYLILAFDDSYYIRQGVKLPGVNVENDS